MSFLRLQIAEVANTDVNIYLAFGIVSAIIVLAKVVERLIPPKSDPIKKVIEAIEKAVVQNTAVLQTLQESLDKIVEGNRELVSIHRGIDLVTGRPLSDSDKLKIPFYCRIEQKKL